MKSWFSNHEITLSRNHELQNPGEGARLHVRGTLVSGNHDHSNGCCGSKSAIKLDVKLGELVATLPRPKPKPRPNPVPNGETKLAYYVGVDVGSTTVKSVIVD